MVKIKSLSCVWSSEERGGQSQLVLDVLEMDDEREPKGASGEEL